MDVDLGLDDRHEPGRYDLPADLELLVHDGLDAGLVGLLDHGTHLGAKDARGFRFREQRIEARHRLHDLCAVDLVGQALVHLEKRDDVLDVPEVRRRRLALHFAVHRVLEKNRAEDALAVERRAGHDACAHGMHHVEHLFVIRPRVGRYAVKSQCLGRTAAALVERGDESGGVPDLFELLFVVAHWGTCLFNVLNVMVCGILQETGRISSRFAAALGLFLVLEAHASASPLFADGAIIDIALSGPLGTISSERQDDDRSEYPFVLTVDGKALPVKVRVRGQSRTVTCRFPPLRLNFSGRAAKGTVFEGQDKLKLVTHCRNGQAHYENNTLDEYAAYRIFNEISDASYRVRLLRIRYEDTDAKLRHLDRPYYGFVIESTAELASRLGGKEARIDGVLYSRLDESQTARLNVFQYLVANTDWSFVTATAKSNCCHNIDLIEVRDSLLAIPYDFDRSGLVDARYAKPAEEMGIRSVTTRLYRGYCRSPIEAVAAAVNDIAGRRDGIMAVIDAVPVVTGEGGQARTEYVGHFFDEVTDDREKLLEKFDWGCIGKR